MSTRMKLTVAYLGGPFAGWQRQPADRTVQGELEAAIQRVTGGLEVAVVGAGRTDAGVHARAQVAHVDLPVAIPPGGLVRALNGTLPAEIRVRCAVPAPPGFHARRSARGKHYSYRVRWGAPPLPWQALRCASLQPPKDWPALEAAVAMLPGHRDWASFTVTDPEQGPTVRTVHQVRLHRRRDGLTLHVVGGGFLRYQVRRMTGALFEVAWCRRSLAELAALLDQPAAGSSLYSVPACGLTLERVLYGPAAVLDCVPQG